MLCSRKINDEINFLEGMHTNAMFIAVMIFIIGLQCFVMFGYKISDQIALAFSVHMLGLTSGQWLLSVLVGLVTFPINFGLKFVPDTWCIVLGEEPEGDVEAADKEYQKLLNIASKYKSSKVRENSNSKKLGNYIDNKQGDSFKMK